MYVKRLIARLDIKAPNLVKGIQLEGLRKLGYPSEFAKSYYEQGIDELLYIDIVASLYERSTILDLICSNTKDVFVPITVGGGIRSVNDAKEVLHSGADKIAINTAAIKNPKLISDIAEHFGKQCMVIHIEAKKVDHNRWEAYYDNGRERSGFDVIDWAKRAVKKGAGEILITSVDCEGTAQGMDIKLICELKKHVTVPIVVSGGAGTSKHISDAYKVGASAVACAHMLHYNVATIANIKQNLLSYGYKMRL